MTDADGTYSSTPEAAPSEVVVARRETLAELSSRWIESRVDVRQNTRDGYTTWLAPVRRHLGERAVADLTIADMRELVAWLSREGGRRGQPLSATSTRDSIRALRMALDVLSKRARSRRTSPALEPSDSPARLGRPLAPRTYADRWTRLCKSAGVPVFGLHKARATLVQLLIARGVPIDIAAAILGHTVAVFEAHYLPYAGTDPICEHAPAIFRAA